MKELKRTIKDKELENQSVTDDLLQLNVAVNERRHIHQVNGM